MQEPRGRERFGIGPHGVEVEGGDGERPIGDHAVEDVPGEGTGLAQHAVIGPSAEQDLGLRPCRHIVPHRLAHGIDALEAGHVETMQDAAATEEMHVGFDEARKHRLVLGRYHARAGALQARNVRLAADAENPAVFYRQGRRSGML